MKTIVVNGANGYVASNFICNLLKHKHRVIALARGNSRCSPEERMETALSEADDRECVDLQGLKVYSYSLLDEDFSISEEQLKEIFKGNVDYFHFAASLKYDFKSKDEIFKTNIGGVENSVKVYSKYANSHSRFFLIGTAYSCGKFPGLFEEKFYPDEDISAFRNYYEQSKRFAENVLKTHIECDGLNGHIIRLSQVVGNNQSGVTKTDYGIFDFAKRIQSIASRYPNRTVRVHVDSDSTQNLIPVDTVVSYLTEIIEDDQLPVIMNFVSKKPVKNNDIIHDINELLPINIIPLKNFNREDMNPIERIINAGMSFTGSYADTSIRFDTAKRDKIITTVNNEVTEHTVFKMLKYFIENISEKKMNKTQTL